MKETTEWKPKNGSKKLRSGGSGKAQRSSGDSGLMKAGLAIAAGLIIAALARGVKDSDYYD